MKKLMRCRKREYRFKYIWSVSRRVFNVTSLTACTTAVFFTKLVLIHQFFFLRDRRSIYIVNVSSMSIGKHFFNNFVTYNVIPFIRFPGFVVPSALDSPPSNNIRILLTPFFDCWFLLRNVNDTLRTSIVFWRLRELNTNILQAAAINTGSFV